MNQPTLLDRPHATIEPIPVAQETALALPPQPGASLMEFRKSFMGMSIPAMLEALAEYSDWRKAFRQWLLSFLIEGIHYGFSPGCAPKWCDARGKEVPESEATHSLQWQKGGPTPVPLKQWTPKRALFAAGGDSLCDIMWMRDTYEADMEAWQQFGSIPGILIRKCKLHSKITGEFMGEGTGGRTNGQNKGDVNNSIKMADKNAKNSAVLNTLSLRDLFTLDEENQPPHENPPADPKAPITPPRDDRVTKEDLTELVAAWKNTQSDPANADPAKFKDFVERATGAEFNVRKWEAWTPTYLERARKALKGGA